MSNYFDQLVNKRFRYRRGIEHVTANGIKNPNCNVYINNS